MKWKQLLSKTRLGREDDPISNDIRSEYMRDWDRIVYSSAFRRMQDKTQVFPLAESDYVRTRLTHSIEVSSVGRSLGTLAGQFILERDPQPDVTAQDIGNIVATACLAHDIGNPPFGHSGEEAIRAWFHSERGRFFLEDLLESEQQDFLQFEGNAQGFRILTRLQNAVGRGGLQLTYAALGTFTKYPRLASSPNADPEKVSEKKHGYCVEDSHNFERICIDLGLIKKQSGAYVRHPLAFLMEAADDICYRVVDLEDGHRLGRVSFDKTEALLKPLAFQPREEETSSYSDITDERSKVEYLRARSINNLAKSAVDVFKQHYERIMSGEFDTELTKLSSYSKQLDEIKKVSRKHVYATPAVLHIEAAGFEVLGGLLDKIVPALLSPSTSAENKLREIIPEQFKRGTSNYQKLLSATDFVSGMTDSFAVTLFRRLKGIELPHS